MMVGGAARAFARQESVIPDRGETERLQRSPINAGDFTVPELRQRLEEVEAKLRACTNQLSETQRIARLCSFKWDASSRELEWADALFRLLGRDPATFRPTLASTLDSIHEDDREKVQLALLAAVRGGPNKSVEFRVPLPDGSIRHLWGTCRQELNAEGECVQLIGFCQDITEIKAAEHKLRESEENLRHIIECSPHIP